MASEIVRAETGTVVAIGGNAIHDHDQYRIPLLFAGPAGGLGQADVGASFDVRDTGLFFSCPVRLRLMDLQFGEINTAIFRLEEFREAESATG